MRQWMCYYCSEARKQNYEEFVFSTVDEVYVHWKSDHSNENANGSNDDANGAGKQKPFRFCSIDLLYCHIDNCQSLKTFQGLRNHHRKKHPNDLFVAIMNDRCALCPYSGDGLHSHRCDGLQNGLQLKLYNPVLLTDEDVVNLQAVESEEHKQNRPKHIECQHCGSVFESRQEMTQHHYHQHRYEDLNLFFAVFVFAF